MTKGMILITRFCVVIGADKRSPKKFMTGSGIFTVKANQARIFATEEGAKRVAANYNYKRNINKAFAERAVVSFNNGYRPIK